MPAGSLTAGRTIRGAVIRSAKDFFGALSASELLPSEGQRSQAAKFFVKMQRLSRLTLLARGNLGAERGDGTALLVDLGLQRADICLLRYAGRHGSVTLISLEGRFELRDFCCRRCLAGLEFGDARIKRSLFLIGVVASLERRKFGFGSRKCCRQALDLGSAESHPLRQWSGPRLSQFGAARSATPAHRFENAGLLFPL